MDCVPSANTRRGPVFFVAAAWHSSRPGPNPSSASDGYQVKTLSSVMRMSAWPSPARSTKLSWDRSSRGSGSDGTAEGLPALVLGPFVEARRWSGESTRSSWPSPERSRNCRPASRVQRQAERQPTSTGAKRLPQPRARPASGEGGRAQVALVRTSHRSAGEDAGAPSASRSTSS